jgi:hypothetical protein
VIKFLIAEGNELERLDQSSHPNTGHEGLEGELRYSSTLDVGEVQPKKMNQVLLYGNARPHTILRTREAIANMAWIVLPQPHYSFCLVPSNFHHFGPQKDAPRTRRFVDIT